jgi:hypothetical protein
MMDYLQSDPKKGLAAGHAKVLSLSRTRNPHAVARAILVFIDGGQRLYFRSNLKTWRQFFASR